MSQLVPEDAVAPVKDCTAALGRIKGPLAALAANAPLTRPARPESWLLPERRGDPIRMRVPALRKRLRSTNCCANRQCSIRS